MNASENARSAAIAAEKGVPGGGGLEVREWGATGRTAADRAWVSALAYAQEAGVSDPEAFADDYAAMIEGQRYEIRYPDEPVPTPAEFVWP